MKRKLVPLALLFAFMLVGCAGWKKGVVGSYEGGAISLKALQAAAKVSCDSGALSQDRCAQIKKIYNETRIAYIKAGDVLILAVETDDVASRKALLAEYQVLIAKFLSLLNDLTQLAIQYGLIK